MPKYTVTCRGSLISKGVAIPTGSTVEMSEKDAASLPPGTVSLIESAPVTPNPKPEAPAAAKPSKEKKS